MEKIYKQFLREKSSYEQFQETIHNQGLILSKSSDSEAVSDCLYVKLALQRTSISISKSLRYKFCYKKSSSLISLFFLIFADDNANHTQKESQEMKNKDMSSIYQDQSAQPCHLSSSIYYGGQDVYTHPQNSYNSGANSAVSILDTSVYSLISFIMQTS